MTIERLSRHVPKAYAFTAQALNSISNLFIAWFLIRQIGVDGFGYYAVYFMIAVNVSMVTIGLLIQPLNSVASQLSDRWQIQMAQAANHGQAIASGLIVLAGALGTALAFILDYNPMFAVATAFYSLGMNFGEHWRRLYFFDERHGRALAYDLIRTSLIAAALILVPNIGVSQSPESYTLALAATYPVATFAIMLVQKHERRPAISRERRNALLLKLLGSGKWLGLAAFLRFITGRLVILLSIFVLGPYQAGLLRLTQTLVSALNPAIQTIEHVLPTKLGRQMREVGFEIARRQFRVLGGLTLVAFGAAYLLLSLLAGPLLTLMNAEATEEARYLVWGFSLVMLTSVAVNLLTIELRAKELTRAVSDSLFIAAAIALIVAYPAVVYLGTFGVIACLLFTQFVSLAILLCLYRKGESI